MKSLDPRINRFNIDATAENLAPKTMLDQFQTYEVFQQVKEGKAFEHVGIVHAPSIEMAFLFGKEQYSRRGGFCTALSVVPTSKVKVSEYTDDEKSPYENINQIESTGTAEQYEIFHLKKRGKHHQHVGSVTAKSYEDAAWEAKQLYGNLTCLNFWVIRNADMLFTNEEDKDIWNTLSEKKYRDAIAYKSMDKITQFKQSQQAGIAN